jgi:hypothetical protein
METKDMTVTKAADIAGPVKITGNGDAWALLGKATHSTQGWMKSSKAYEIAGVGCMVQVTTQQTNPDGSYAVAEAVCFVPGVRIVDDVSGGRKLVRTA